LLKVVLDAVLIARVCKVYPRTLVRVLGTCRCASSRTIEISHKGVNVLA
jgi:hypothetical protein